MAFGVLRVLTTTARPVLTLMLLLLLLLLLIYGFSGHFPEITVC